MTTELAQKVALLLFLGMLAVNGQKARPDTFVC